LPKIPLISVIDDNESVGWAMARVIKSAGLGVEVFKSAEEFLLSSQMSSTACLVLDVQLPGMSGLQLQSHLAAAGRHIPIIFITATTDEKARTLAIRSGALNVLDKSSGDKTLLKEIRLVLTPKDQEGLTTLPSPGKSRP
jgi:FixJ family two-component response regulator